MKRWFSLYIVFIFAGVVATILVFPFLFGFYTEWTAKTWKYEHEEPDVFGEYSSRSFVESKGDEGRLIVAEIVEEEWTRPRHLIGIALKESCPKKGVPVVKVWIDGWSDSIPAQAVEKNEGACTIGFFPHWRLAEETVNLIRRINHGNTMIAKWSNGPGESRLIKFKVGGATGFLQGESIK